MTDASTDEVLDSDDHNRGLENLHADIVAIARPCPGLQRLTVSIGDGTPGGTGPAVDPTWARPNVAVRLNLGPDFDDASRIYTVRDFDSTTGRFVIDIVQHGASSPMMRWGAALAVGDRVAIVGPRPHFLVPERHADAVLFADGSALPALYEILRQWPSRRRGRAFVSSADDLPVDELPRPAGVVVHRVMGPAALAEAATTIDDGAYSVWAAGERDEMRIIRRHFRAMSAIAKDDVAVFGYWKRGITNTEIDAVRLTEYRKLVAAGGSLGDFDDLALGV